MSLSPLFEEFAGSLPQPGDALQTLARFVDALGLEFDTFDEAEIFVREYFAHLREVTAAVVTRTH